MRAVVIILLSLISLLSFSQDDLYKWGRPTSKGVDAYVERNWLVFIEDYQEFVNDTLFFEPFISTDDLSDYVNYTRGDMGYYERPDNIIISNEPRYIDYELSRLSDYEKNRYREATQFVRGVVVPKNYILKYGEKEVQPIDFSCPKYKLKPINARRHVKTFPDISEDDIYDVDL